MLNLWVYIIWALENMLCDCESISMGDCSLCIWPWTTERLWQHWQTIQQIQSFNHKKFQHAHLIIDTKHFWTKIRNFTNQTEFLATIYQLSKKTQTNKNIFTESATVLHELYQFYHHFNMILYKDRLPCDESQPRHRSKIMNRATAYPYSLVKYSKVNWEVLWTS